MGGEHISVKTVKEIKEYKENVETWNRCHQTLESPKEQNEQVFGGEEGRKPKLKVLSIVFSYNIQG